MSFKTTLRYAAFVGGVLLSSAAHADQLCNVTASGTTYGCMYVTWECGTFTVPEGQACVSTIAAPNADITKEVGHSGGSHEIGDFEADIADMQQKKAVNRSAPQMASGSGEQKATGCPPLCMPEPVIVEPPIE